MAYIYKHSSLIEQFQVTSAFDGTRMTKWEEPNGAKGKVYVCYMFEYLNRKMKYKYLYQGFEIGI